MASRRAASRWYPAARAARCAPTGARPARARTAACTSWSATPGRCRSPLPPAAEAGHRVGAPALEGARHPGGIELERAQRERRGRRQQLHLHSRESEARQLHVPPDLVDHPHLEGFLERAPHRGGRTPLLLRRIAHHHHRPLPRGPRRAPTPPRPPAPPAASASSTGARPVSPPSTSNVPPTSTAGKAPGTAAAAISTS